MVGFPLEPGTILPLVREVTGSPDPLALYGALCDGGRRAGTFLLESGETASGSGERSLLGVSPALRIACTGRTVEVRAMSANGRSLLPWIADRLRCPSPHGAAAPEVSSGGTAVRAVFPPPPAGPRDEAERVRLASPLDALRAVVLGPRLLAHPTDSSHLAAGVFSYDLVELFEALPPGRPEAAPTPHLEFFVPDRLIIVDHVRHRTLLVANAYGGPDGEANYHDAVRGIGELMRAVEAQGSASSEKREGKPANPSSLLATSFSLDLTDAEYAALVVRLKQYIVAGDVFQIVASRTFELACADPLAAYGRLRAANPSPYLFYVRGEESVVFGASPETAVKVHGVPRRVTIRPIAGTAPRGRGPDGGLDPDLDARREAALHLDEKETAEHMMLVDLARNDVARVSRPGTRRVTRLLTVDRYAHVMHLVSEVQGDLAEGYDALHAYAAAMNMGTLVGAPKIRAAEILREVEPSRRGAYGGAVGYLTHDGTMDTAIVIRAAVVRNGTARVRAGAGIVFDSDPASEANETRRKAEAVLRAIAPAGVPDG
ncbi:MAG TPA: anthranilate synthase component 1 [Gemmatimonadales bacterium]|jgi:anthranilate synthase component 1|nr:anthranilate synthase component 1 [Gemmatimonadales bacterium]